MGSSVFHGGFSTFLAVGVMGFAKLYSFVVFFKTWCCILFFGMLNGIILLPILLSMIGPIDSHDSEKKETDKELEVITHNRKTDDFSFSEVDSHEIQSKRTAPMIN